MFIKAFLTLVAADAVDRQMREQQHRAWMAEEQARAAAGRASAHPDVFALPTTTQFVDARST